MSCRGQKTHLSLQRETSKAFRMKQTLLLLFFLFSAKIVFSQSAFKGMERPDLAIFPNPAVDFIAVNDEDAVVNQIVIFNLVGKRVRSFDAAPNERFPVGDLPKGMYLVQLLDHDNKIINTQKVNKK